MNTRYALALDVDPISAAVSLALALGRFGLGAALKHDGCGGTNAKRTQMQTNCRGYEREYPHEDGGVPLVPRGALPKRGDKHAVVHQALVRRTLRMWPAW